MSFEVIFYARDLTHLISQPPVRLQVERLRWSAFGGAASAVVHASGSPVALADLTNWLRCPLSIHNDLGQLVWWGYLNEVSLGRAGGVVHTSLEEMANRVAVAYTSLAPADQGGESQMTAWAEDPLSQARYGVKERVIRRGNIDESFALQLRDHSLAQQKQPPVSLAPGVMQSLPVGQARLDCRGWMHTLSWRSFQTSAGLISNASSQQGTQALGDASNHQELAQSFVPSADIALGSVDLRIRREGSPTDNLVLSIQADSSGVPSGTSLGSVSIGGASLAEESYPWVRFSFNTPVSLSANARYWLVIGRSGALSTANYYQLGVDERLSYTPGRFKIYDQGSGVWLGRVPNTDLLFKAFGARETTLQLADIYQTGNQFFTGFDARVASGVFTPPFESGADTCLDVFERLLQLGTTNQRLLTAWVSAERRLVVQEQAKVGVCDHWLDENGAYYDHLGNRLMSGVLPVGEWVRLKDGSSPAAFMAKGEWPGV